MESHESKICATCGRPFAWRRRWARVWPRVLYCSVRCRREKPGTIDARLEAAILQLLAARPGRTICPSEAARLVAPDDWKTLMERTRRAARRLAAHGRIEILQQGRPVDAGSVRGPVRLRPVRR